jgi:hypothetical protein
MKVLQVILGMVALILVAFQTYRHAYLLWIVPRESVLSKYDKTEQKIIAAKGLDELVSLYEKAREQEEKEQKTSAPAPAPVEEIKTPDGLVTRMSPHKDTPAEQLKKAIETWEDHDKQLHQVHFFWWTGLFTLISGFLGYYLINRWLGMTGIIAAFCEMIWWTSPSLRLREANIEFDRLLLIKFIYAAATYALVLMAWCLLGGFFSRRARNASSKTVAQQPAAAGDT